MTDRTRRLRALLKEPGPLVVVEAYSAMTARVVEQAGFNAVYCGGSALGGMHYGIPDHGLITVTEMVEQAGRIANAVSIPLIADADQGGETSLNVRRTVQAFEEAGVSGIHIEDTVNPKHLYSGDHLQPVKEMCARIKAAVDARSDDDFLIIARSDEVFNDGSLDEAIARGNAYADAGADAYMCLMASRTRRDVPTEDYLRIVAEVSIPFVDITVPVQRATDVGIGIDIFTGPAVFAAAARHRELVADVRDSGGSNWRNSLGLTWEEYTELMQDEQWMPVAKAWQASQPS